MKKNVAGQLISAQMVSATDGSDVTAGTCNVAVEVDGVAGTGGTATHIANGKWEYAPIQADTNGDYLTFQFVISGALTTTVQVYTHFPQSVDNETRLATIEADTSELQTDDVPGLIAALNDPTAATIADAVWDETLTGAEHNDANSAGRRLRQVDAGFIVAEGTAQAGGSNTITLAVGSSATNDIYRGDRVQIIGGTGAGEHEIIISYVGSTQVATVADTWVTTPDATSEYILIPASVDVESIQHVVQTGADLGNLITTVDTVVDGIQADLDNGTDGLGAIKADTAAILADTGTDGVVLSSATQTAIADALLNRDMSAVSDTNARSPLNALRLLRNKYSVSGTTMTVTKEDDSTSAWTSTLTTDAAADPVTGSDPA